MIIGFVLACKAWVAWGVIPGLLVGFLFTGGLGWRIVGGLPRFIWTTFLMPGRKHSNYFMDAWERQYGPIRVGRQETYPPPGTFQAWYREFRRSGVDPAEWIAYGGKKRPSKPISDTKTVRPPSSRPPQSSYKGGPELTLTANWDDTTSFNLRKCRGVITATPRGLLAKEEEWREPDVEDGWQPSNGQYYINWQLFRYIESGTDGSTPENKQVLLLDAGIVLYYFVVVNVTNEQIAQWVAYAMAHGYAPKLK